ncbi:hypothetical protein [Streptomyces lavendulae]|uniref:hypothetical protein n=1 Tax=Streptomyces lavendulae TaxID=1914 RepID=UPI0033C263FD
MSDREQPIEDDGPFMTLRAEVVTARFADDPTLDFRIRERRLAVDLASAGIDYPYTYPGAPFSRSAFGAAVSA